MRFIFFYNKFNSTDLETLGFSNNDCYLKEDRGKKNVAVSTHLYLSFSFKEEKVDQKYWKIISQR